MDFRVKTFAREAADRFGFLCEEHGFTGPLVISDSGGVYPLLPRVRYERPGQAVEVSLVLSYMGDWCCRTWERSTSPLTSSRKIFPNRPAVLSSGRSPRTPATRCGMLWTGIPARSGRPWPARTQSESS